MKNLSSLAAQMVDFKVIDFLKKHKSTLLLIAVLAICSGIFFKKNAKHSRPQKLQEIVLIKDTFEKCRKNELPPNEVLDSVHEILKRNPELHPQYDGQLTLLYHTEEKPDRALASASLLLKRTQKHLPDVFATYAANTLLIIQGKYADALEKTVELQQVLKNESPFQTLSGFNLLRLAFLADASGDAALFTTTWKELKEHPSFPMIASVFQEGKTSLHHYVHHRYGL